MAGRHARRSRLAMAIALVGAGLVALAVAYATLGYAGCTTRGDCSRARAVLHWILDVVLLVLVVRVGAAMVDAVWGGTRAERAGRRAEPAKVGVGA